MEKIIDHITDRYDKKIIQSIFAKFFQVNDKIYRKTLLKFYSLHCPLILRLLSPLMTVEYACWLGFLGITT